MVRFAFSDGFGAEKLRDATIIIPAVSASLVECFAIDYLVENLGLIRVGIFESANADSLVQPAVFTQTDKEKFSAFTTAIELFSNSDCSLFVFQIRSTVFSRSGLAGELVQFARDHSVGEIIVLGGSDACILSGPDLEILGENPIEIYSPASQIPANRALVGSGMTKYLVRETGGECDLVLATTRGQGFVEIALVARELATRLLTRLQLRESKPGLAVPLSVQGLLGPVRMGDSVGRIL